LVRHFNDGAVVWTGNAPDIASSWPPPERESGPDDPSRRDVMESISEFTPEMMRARNERIAGAKGGYPEAGPLPKRDQRGDERPRHWIPGDQ
jgi:hypothetical protein